MKRLLPLLFLALFGLGCGGSEGSQPTDAGPDQTVSGAGDSGSGDLGSLPLSDPYPTPFVVITDPTGTGVATTPGDSIDLHGVLAGAMNSLSYAATRAGKAVASGDLKAETAWKLEGVPLAPGDTTITVTATDAGGAKHTDTIVVTRTPGLSMEPVAVEPTEIVTGQKTAVRVSVRMLPTAGGSAVAARAVEVDAAGKPTGKELGTLTDDGTGGDRVAGDGVYSAEVLLDDSTEKTHHLRVSAAPGSGSPCASEVRSVRVIAPLTSTEVDRLEKVWDAAVARYKVHSATLARKEALDKTAADLGAMPGVAEAWTGTYVVSWTMDSGIEGHYTVFPPGTKGGLSVPQEPSAVVLDPFAAEFKVSGDAQGKDIATILEQTLCPRLQPVVIHEDDKATLDDFRTLDRYGVIFIDSHGYASRGRVYIDTSVEIDRKDLQDPASRLVIDAKTKRLSSGVATVNGKTFAHYTITPEFIRHYNRFAKNTIVHVGSCESAANASMAKAFIQNGAAVYTGYTGEVGWGWGKAVALSYFKELRDTRTVAEAVALTRKRHGKFDPGHPGTRLVYNSGRGNRLQEACSGYTRIIDNVDHPKGTRPSAPRVTGKTVYLSVDTIVPDPGGDLVMRRGARQCSFSKRVPTGFGELQSLDTAAGVQEQDYPALDPFKFDPDVRYNVKKLSVDRTAGEVKLWLTPEGARRSQDMWVTWQRWDLNKGSWSEELGCPFEGAIGAIPGFNGPSDYILVSGSNVKITDEVVEGTVSYKNDQGTGQVVFRYLLKGKKGP